MTERVLLWILHWAQAHEGLVWENSVLVFTAFLFKSPAPGVKWTRDIVYGWVRGSLFTIFNRNHPPDTADPKS